MHGEIVMGMEDSDIDFYMQSQGWGFDEDDIFSCSYCNENTVYGEEHEASNGDLCCSETCVKLYDLISECGCRFENDHSSAVILCESCAKLPCHNLK